MVKQYHESDDETGRLCEFEGCGEKGSCPAPRRRENVDSSGLNGVISPWRTPGEYYWFCPVHARIYNMGWDYFQGMNSDEILHFQESATYGHRPTWTPEGQRKSSSPEGIFEALCRQFPELGGAKQSQEQSAPKEIPQHYRKALAQLNLTFPTTRSEVKIRYKALVKECHPDVNRGDKRKEEQFKQISEAYRLLNSWDLLE